MSIFQVSSTRVLPTSSLDPLYQFGDAPTFDIYRSRIPTPLFKKIVEDIKDMMIQYGPPEQYETEEATSRFFSPVRLIHILTGLHLILQFQIFDRLVPMFSYTLRNLPESSIEGRFTTGNLIKHYFVAFGSISVLVVEVKHRIMGNRLNGIAHVIAESDGLSCDIKCWY